MPTLSLQIWWWIFKRSRWNCAISSRLHRAVPWTWIVKLKAKVVSHTLSHIARLNYGGSSLSTPGREPQRSANQQNGPSSSDALNGQWSTPRAKVNDTCWVPYSMHHHSTDSVRPGWDPYSMRHHPGRTLFMEWWCILYGTQHVSLTLALGVDHWPLSGVQIVTAQENLMQDDQGQVGQADKRTDWHQVFS